MTELFQLRQIEKVYWAVVEKEPAQEKGALFHHLQTDHKKNKSSVREVPATETANAVLEYTLIGRSDRYAFLVVRLITGKQHQIRAQLAALGCPVKDDVKYGARRGNPDRSIFLHARSLRFTHPVTKEPVALTAPPPDNILWTLFLEGTRLQD